MTEATKELENVLSITVVPATAVPPFPEDDGWEDNTFNPFAKKNKEIPDEDMKGDQSKYTSRKDNVDGDEWDWDAGDARVAEKLNYLELVNRIVALPPAVVEVLRRCTGNTHASKAWWDTIVMKHVETYENYPTIFSKFQIARIRSACDTFATNRIWVDDDLSEQEIEHAMHEYLRANGQKTSTTNAWNGETVIDYDIKRYVPIKVSKELKARNLLFHSICTFKRSKLEKDGVVDVKRTGFHESPFQFTPNEWWTGLSPTLFPEEKGKTRNLVMTMFNQFEEKITETEGINTSDWMFTYNYKCPLIRKDRDPKGVAPIACPPLGSWCFVPDLDKDLMNALCDRTTFYGNYIPKPHRMLASMINWMIPEKTPIGGHLSAEIFKWFPGFSKSFTWVTSGDFLSPYDIQVKQSFIIADEDARYATPVIVFPDPKRQNVSNKPDVVFFSVKSDENWKNMEWWLDDTELYKIYFLVSQTPVIAFKKDKTGAFRTQYCAHFKNNVLAMTISLLVRNVEYYLAGIQPSMCYEMDFRVKVAPNQNPLMMWKVISSGSFWVLVTRWVKVEKSSKVIYRPTLKPKTDFKADDVDAWDDLPRPAVLRLASVPTPDGQTPGAK